MFKRRAELTDGNGIIVATFNEVCHHHGTTAATVKLRAPLAPFKLQGTESLAISSQRVSLSLCYPWKRATLRAPIFVNSME
jgi:hypothetical protein